MNRLQLLPVAIAGKLERHALCCEGALIDLHLIATIIGDQQFMHSKSRTADAGPDIWLELQRIALRYGGEDPGMGARREVDRVRLQPFATAVQDRRGPFERETVLAAEADLGSQVTRQQDLMRGALNAPA